MPNHLSAPRILYALLGPALIVSLFIFSRMPVAEAETDLGETGITILMAD